MSSTTSWLDANSHYLSAGLAWLRARLERLANQHQPPPLITPPPPAPASAVIEQMPEPPKPRWLRTTRLDITPQVSSPILLPAATTPVTPAVDSVAKAEAELAAAGQMQPLPALLSLRDLLGLSPFEQDILLLCIGIEFDSAIPGLCARAQADVSKPYPTFSLALRLFDDPSWDALAPEHALRYWRLIEVTQAEGQPLTTSPLRADERIVNYVKGLNYVDQRISTLTTRLEGPAEADVLPPSHEVLASKIKDRLNASMSGNRLQLVQLQGPDSGGKKMIAGSVADALKLITYQMDCSVLPVHSAEADGLARLWKRESLLLGAALYLDATECETSGTGTSNSISRFIARLDGVVFVESRDPMPGMPAGLSVEVNSPTPAEQAACWAEALGDSSGQSPDLLAGQFNLSLPSIRRIAREALSESKETPLPQRLWHSSLEATRPRLDTLAQRLQGKATWEDLVLPAEKVSLLQQIAAQVAQRSHVYQKWGFSDKMSRGFGISALFAGDSGTGKTMAAEVIANQLSLNLYRIDLSAVVSKYIGETEKNLRRLFDAAEDGGAILFFDEADALFGKRSEVKDSHDRYANIEINYLLQRMEAYRGLAILATNMKSTLDQAFMRRLRFVVDFPFPSATERKLMWQKVFPSSTPVSGLNFDALGRLNLTGGNIQSIALNAAFVAAASGSTVTHAMLLEAARSEMRKLGRVVNELEFRQLTKAGAA